MREKKQKENPKIPSRLRGRGVEVSKTLFYFIGKSVFEQARKNPMPEIIWHGKKMSMLKNEKSFIIIFIIIVTFA